MFRLWGKCVSKNRVVRETVAEDGDDKKTPAPVENIYTIDGVTYYNVYQGKQDQGKKEFDRPDLLLPTLLSAPILDSKGKVIYEQTRMDKMWMDVGFLTKLYSEGVQSFSVSDVYNCFSVLHNANMEHENAHTYEVTGDVLTALCTNPIYSESFGTAVDALCAKYRGNPWGASNDLANRIKAKDAAKSLNRPCQRRQMLFSVMVVFPRSGERGNSQRLQLFLQNGKYAGIRFIVE